MQPSSPTATGNGDSAAAPKSSPAAFRLSNLSLRLLAALAGLPLLVTATWLGDPWFALLVVAAALAAVWEFNRLGAAAHGDLFEPLVYGSVLLFLLDAQSSGGLLPFILTGTVLLGLAWSLAKRHSSQAGNAGWLWSTGGALYIGWLLGHYLGLRGLEQGREWVMLALLATFLNDTAAYVIGRAVGRHRMAPRISPGKTWEGAVGGFATTALATPPLALLLGLPGNWTLWPLAMAISSAAQGGDLAESLLKRSAGVKDTSGLIPGHGGLLDRMDSLVLVGPLVYYYVQWIILAP